MLGKSPNQNQMNLFKPVLKQIINPQDPLVILSSEINWNKLEDEFAPLYSNTGQPSCPVRQMAGLLILKQLFNKGDETVIESWIHNPYYQFFVVNNSSNEKSPATRVIWFILGNALARMELKKYSPRA